MTFNVGDKVRVTHDFANNAGVTTNDVLKVVEADDYNITVVDAYGTNWYFSPPTNLELAVTDSNGPFEVLTELAARHNVEISLYITPLGDLDE